MTWIKSNCGWATLNLFAFSMVVIVMTQGSTNLSSRTFDPELESAKWAIRFLLTCLAMSPLHTYLGWISALKLRKPAGLWAYAFAILHLLFYISDVKLNWLNLSMPLFQVLGLSGFVILTALAFTSNSWAMKHLRKNWKRLHRFVYLASLAVTFHAILATTMSKKLAVRDPQSANELKIYLGMVVLLLVVRLPQIQRLLKQVAIPWRSRRQADVPITPIIVPKYQPEYPPKIYASEMGIPANRFISELQLAQHVENAEENLQPPMNHSLRKEKFK